MSKHPHRHETLDDNGRRAVGMKNSAVEVTNRSNITHHPSTTGSPPATTTTTATATSPSVIMRKSPIRTVSEPISNDAPVEAVAVKTEAATQQPFTPRRTLLSLDHFNKRVDLAYDDRATLNSLSIIDHTDSVRFKRKQQHRATPVKRRSFNEISSGHHQQNNHSPNGIDNNLNGGSSHTNSNSNSNTISSNNTIVNGHNIIPGMGDDLLARRCNNAPDSLNSSQDLKKKIIENMKFKEGMAVLLRNHSEKELHDLAVKRERVQTARTARISGRSNKDETVAATKRSVEIIDMKPPVTIASVVKKQHGDTTLVDSDDPLPPSSSSTANEHTTMTTMTMINQSDIEGAFRNKKRGQRSPQAEALLSEPPPPIRRNTHFLDYPKVERFHNRVYLREKAERSLVRYIQDTDHVKKRRDMVQKRKSDMTKEPVKKKEVQQEKKANGQQVKNSRDKNRILIEVSRAQRRKELTLLRGHINSERAIRKDKARQRSHSVAFVSQVNNILKRAQIEESIKTKEEQRSRSVSSVLSQREVSRQRREKLDHILQSEMYRKRLEAQYDHHMAHQAIQENMLERAIKKQLSHYMVRNNEQYPALVRDRIASMIKQERERSSANNSSLSPFHSHHHDMVNDDDVLYPGFKRDLSEHYLYMDQIRKDDIIALKEAFRDRKSWHKGRQSSSLPAIY